LSSPDPAFRVVARAVFISIVYKETSRAYNFPEPATARNTAPHNENEAEETRK
jgi:hypothetical protein